MSEAYLSRNLSIIHQRFPALHDYLTSITDLNMDVQFISGSETSLLVNGVQLSSRFNRLAEAELMAKTLPESCAEITVYGVGLGDLPRLLLQRPLLKKLRVRLLNETLFCCVLHLFEHSDWLSDPRLDLALADEDRIIHEPFVFVPPETVLVSDRCAKVRDWLLFKVSDDFVNANWEKVNPLWAQRIAENYGQFAQDRDLREVLASCQGREALVVAAGPTVNDHIDFIKQQQDKEQKPVILAVDAVYRHLTEQGIFPDYVLSIDQHMSEWLLPETYSDKTALVYFPLLNPPLILTWRGPRYGSYSLSQFYQSLRETIQREPLFSVGSVLHPAVDLAVKLGCQTVKLIGADFAFVGGMSHSGYLSGARQSVAGEWVLNGYGERVATMPNLKNYLLGLEYYIAQHPQVDFINMSKKGACIQGARYE